MVMRVLVVYGSKGFYALLMVGVSSYVARVWGAGALGDYSVFLTMLTVGSVLAVFGADMRYIETAPKVLGDVYPEGKAYASQVIRAVVWQALIAAPLLYVAIQFVVPEFALGATAVILMAILTIMTSIFVSQNRQVLSSVLVFIARPILFIAGVFVAATSGLGVAPSIITAMNVSFAIVCSAGALLLCARSGGLRVRGYFTKEWWQAAWVYVVIGLYPILFSQADRLILLELSGSQETGMYSAAQNILNIPTYAVNAVMALALPMIAAVLAGKLPEGEFHRNAKYLARGAFGFAVLCVGAFALFGSQILTIFGEEFDEATLPLVIMSIGIATGLLFGFPISVLTLSESRRSVVWLLAAALVVSLLLSTLGILWFGVVGAAVAAAVANVASRAVFHIICVKRTGINTSVF
ncbi:hypothetical protein ABZ477_08885 [Microbacterium sp. NPDC019599]|uniref:hypothetical protein n=1 Tax=Microbacterium sp. NPDC019599 TaxID=3154690 RepID=UPI0033D8D4C6